MKSLAFTDDAANEYESAIRWYETDRRGRGAAFMDSVETTLTHIQHSPEAFRSIPFGCRRATVSHFPYSVIFSIELDQIVVHAIFHNAREPRRLQRRLRQR
jgi:plasmid stabilization system protein ParE